MKKFFILSMAMMVTVFVGSLFMPEVISAKNGFSDKFSGKHVSGKWDVLSGENNIFFNKGIMTFSVSGTDYYPYLKTKKVVFPQNKSFIYETRFAYPSNNLIHGIISAFYYDEAGIPHDILSTRLGLNNIEIRLWNMGTTIPFDTDFHTAKFVWDQEAGTVTSYIDGVFGMERGLPHPPEYIEIGHLPLINNSWGGMSVDYVKVIIPKD